MNIKKSIDLCLVNAGMSNSELASVLDISSQALSYMKGRKNHKTDTIERLAKIFSLSASEFIKLGE